MSLTRAYAGLVLAVVTAFLLATPTGADAVEPSVPYWVVPGQPGAESELTLPGVADRVLGDSRRWPEIFELNQGRTQPDGGTLTDPAQPIRAGWVFVLPEGATSGEIRVGPPPSATPDLGQQPEAPPVDQPEQGPAAAPPAPPDGGGGTFGLRPVAVTLLGIGAVVLAVVVPVLIRLVRRRRAAEPPRPAPGSRQALDRALRQIAAPASQPPVYAAMVGADRVSLRLAPALPDPPPPWRARQQGAIWEAPSWDLDQQVTADGGGLPMLATVGTVGGELTVVNLGRAPGIVALTGEPTAAYRLAGAFLDEISRYAATSVTISVVGPPPPPWPVPERVRVVVDLRSVLMLPGDDAQDAHGSSALRDHLVVVTAPLPPEELERLGALAAASDGTAAVVVVGDAPNTVWRFDIDANGALDVGVLGLHLDRPKPHGRLIPVLGR
ncbi:hypothetical protein GCM10009541_00200 [Micromonospora gifhornensis]|uniref:Uncharacterized protein n=1 Tax=Micromonospora gifhornensis TaxID=84594 RepID=A0ABQ4IJH6_9ACTN|nr:hypothetical protein [Micromonospora gifhornensis]GIJ18058.1 hypothetical protein Vgi01_47420 [Micromonospora gifhornensis]